MCTSSMEVLVQQKTAQNIQLVKNLYSLSHLVMYLTLHPVSPYQNIWVCLTFKTYVALKFKVAMGGKKQDYTFGKKKLPDLLKILYSQPLKDTFREFELLFLSCRVGNTLARGRYTHQHETRRRVDFRIHHHRTRNVEQLPSRTGDKIINKLPDQIKQYKVVRKKTIHY